MESTYYAVLYVVFDWLAKMMFSHVKKSYFLRVFKLSQRPKTLNNIDVCEINVFIISPSAIGEAEF